MEFDIFLVELRSKSSNFGRSGRISSKLVEIGRISSKLVKIGQNCSRSN